MVSPSEVHALKLYHARRRQQELQSARRARSSDAEQSHLDLSRLHDLMYRDLEPRMEVMLA